MIGPGWDFDRSAHPWRVREGEHYVFHLAPSLWDDAELRTVLEEADERYVRILRLLGHDPTATKERERLVKPCYWLYPGAVLQQAAVEAGYPRMACGTASPVGV